MMVSIKVAFKIHERRTNKRDNIIREIFLMKIKIKMNQRERWNEKNNNSHVAKVKSLRMGL